MKNLETGLDYVNTDRSLHFNHHVSEECTYQKHEQCQDLRCACPHHYKDEEEAEEPR
jgi:hypothetical protein